ncbi:2-oxo acid dehydrogenase subunit E2 [Actinomadura kijaniata]|uniref:Dihydrolipoamide acetyltransferase component of pyruvate dehydrogenase complex n=1 Tax=Actinomadura namibiensis TaxID=182080 RepID=A0A7W3LZQ8_ACTNM|nr:dihydrolipoamide acetyltransferase family protein [Actinomadura namibiensis]MBA8957187.1 pyruvate dehydrogenase E2 component (dihydrolipoamide acetyltransferase) [Actinomadura namibiensis]
MTAREFTLPDLGEGLTDAEIVRWMVKVGDPVEIDQPVVEVETAKAVMEVPVPFAGVVTGLNAAEGDTVAVGSVLLVVGDQAAPEPASGPVPAAGAAPGPEAARYIEEERAGSGNVLVGYGTARTRERRRRRRGRPVPVAPPTDRPRTMSPVVRKLARDNGVDLTRLTGTGPDGLITRADVEKAIQRPAPPPVPEPAPAPRTTARPAPEMLPELERIPLRGARKAAAEAFARSRREIPEATTWVDVDATALLELRREINASGRHAPVSLLALFARFVTAGLARHPELNSRVDTEAGEIVRFDGVNLAIAVQAGQGLVAPVVREAHRLSARGLQAEITRLTDAARAGSLTVPDLTAGTFTLNNYGGFGVDGSAPIINHPQAAMLGVGRIIDRPWVVDGELTVRKVGQLSLAFDHRVCDGAPAAAFLRFVADCVENPHDAFADL